MPAGTCGSRPRSRPGGLAPLACKTDRIDCWVLAELARRKLVPEIWLPGPRVRAERERARFRLHLVKHRRSLKNRVHAILFQHGLPSPHRDLFGAGGRCLLGVDHPYVPLLTSVPGVAWVLGYTIASEIGDIGRFASPRKLVGYTGLTPRVEQSGERDRRGPLRKNWPNYLRWALIKAAHTAGRDPYRRPIVER